MSCYDMKIHLGVLSSMVAVTVLAGLALSASVVSADDDTHVSTATITVPVSCTMSGTGMNSHTATIENGRSEENIGTTTLAAYCNDNGGFAIYAVGYSDNTIGNTYLRDSTLGQTADVSTGITFSGNNSAWAMKLTKTVDSGDTTGTNAFTIDSDTEGAFTAYHTVPNQYTKVAHKATATDMDSTNGGAKLTTTYKVYISPTQNSGTYIGQVKYTMVHPVNEVPVQPVACAAGKICYNANTATAEGTMGMQTLIRARDWSSCADTDYETYCYDNNDDNVDISTLPQLNSYENTLLASNFSRDGYGFAGWSDTYDYATNPNANLYGPSETISLPLDTATTGISLYAIWIKSAGSLQDSSKVATLCGTGAGSLTQAPTDSTKTLASVSALTDARDNQTYAIAKLADGKCWMIENLRLETAGSNNESLSQGFGKSTTYGNFSGLATAETANFSNSTTANSLYYSGTQSGTASINIGTTDNPGYRMPRYRNTNTSSRTSSPTDNTGAMYSYGNYYTWSAALANTIYYSGPTATDADGKTSETVNTSICPAGWRLPYGRNSGNGNTAGGLYNLNYKINGNSNVFNYVAVRKLRAYPNNFVFSGNVNSDSIYSRGFDGAYWSSTASTYDRAYYLNFGGSNVYPGTDSNNKFYGFSVRCVLGS